MLIGKQTENTRGRVIIIVLGDGQIDRAAILDKHLANSQKGTKQDANLDFVPANDHDPERVQIVELPEISFPDPPIVSGSLVLLSLLSGLLELESKLSESFKFGLKLDDSFGSLHVPCITAISTNRTETRGYSTNRAIPTFTHKERRPKWPVVPHRPKRPVVPHFPKQPMRKFPSKIKQKKHPIQPKTKKTNRKFIMHKHANKQCKNKIK